jgi:hypothetical protein
MSKIALLAALLAAALSALGAAAAQADIFEGAQLASTGQTEASGLGEQASVAAHPAISANGRYVVFEGTFGGVPGVWRRDLGSPAVVQVAGGDAQLPSISADGRYVSFTTSEGANLAADTNDKIDPPHPETANVYVRDMTKAPSESGAFTIVSAPSGSEAPLTYEGAPQQGAVAAGRTAMSADGQHVAFVTTATSNLVAPGTPPLQVAVRNLATRETQLVSVEDEAGHATSRPVAQEGSFGAADAAANHFEPTHVSASQGASISADGSTVAWLGQEIDRQAAILPGTTTPEHVAEYVEPLWRRVGAPEATRRVTGGSDPTSPPCAASGETQLSNSLSDPCQGPFENTLTEGSGPPGVYANAGHADSLPRLSGDGAVVAFIASQRYLPSGEEFRGAESSSDLYIADMAAGLTRVQALRRLTEVASGNGNIPGGSEAVTDLGVSLDGSQVAFSSARIDFPLGSPAYVSPPVSKPEMEEVYDVDLANDTLTRVTHGYQGETQQSEPGGRTAAEGEAGAPSFTGDGGEIAFSSAASNLVYGDATRLSSVYVAARKHFQGEPVPQFISPAPPPADTEPAWLLSVSAHSRRDGAVVLEVLAPGAGTVTASGRSSVRVRASASRRGGRRHSATKVVSRQVAHGARGAAGEGLVTLVLTPDSHYRALDRQAGGLAALLQVVFTAPGHEALRENLAVNFHDTRHSKRKPKHAHKAGRRR